MSDWDIGIPFISAGKADSIKFPIEFDKPAFCRRRGGTVRGELDTVIKINKKNAVGFGKDDFSLGEDKEEYRKRVLEIRPETELVDHDEVSPSITWAHAVARSRPLLLIHFIQLDPPEGFLMNLSKSEPVVSIGILLPGTKVKCKERKYQASKRLIAMIQALREESLTDEVIEDE